MLDQIVPNCHHSLAVRKSHLKLAQLRSQIPLFVEKQADFIFLRPEGPIVHFLETILGQRTKYFHFLSTFLHRIIRRPNSKHDLEKTMRGKFLEKPTVHNCRSLDKIKTSLVHFDSLIPRRPQFVVLILFHTFLGMH